MKTNRVLGKGLSALIQGADDRGRLGDREVRMVPVISLATNPLQPRKLFNDSALDELAGSIKSVGILQPILVRKLRSDERKAARPLAGAVPDGAPGSTSESSSGSASDHAPGPGISPSLPEFCLVAGERRARAARLAGIDEIPAIICTYEETEALKVALLENIQREDLGPIEEASAYKELLDAYGATQEELADMLGKNRSSVTNALRLLGLESEIKTMLESGDISRGHAKALLGLPDSTARLQLARLCRGRGLSVRECERRVQVLLGGKRPRIRRRRARIVETPEVRELRERAERALGSPVRIERDPKTGKGAINIKFFSDQDLERLLEIVGVDVNLT